MTKILLTAYLPIPKAIAPHNMFENKVSDMLDELCSLSGKLQFPMEEYGLSTIEIDLIQNSEEIQSFLAYWVEWGDLKHCRILRIVARVDIGELHWFNLVNIFHKRVTDIIVAANMASLGSLEIIGGVYLRDGNPHGNIRAMNAYSLREASNFSELRGWPTIKRLSFAKVWEWAIKQPGFLVGFGGNLTGRSINAFTHLFEGLDEPIRLFWSMVALEALYVKGKQGIARQMREKIWLLLGEQETHKKNITGLYDYRSQFVHGGLDFVGMNCYYLPKNLNTEKHEKKLVETSSLAQAILVATIQELIQRNWRGLDFSYKVEDLRKTKE